MDTKTIPSHLRFWITALGLLLASAALQANANETLQENRFDIDFPGGDPWELVSAIEKASGENINALIPERAKALKFPPFRMHGITSTEFFNASSGQSPKYKRVEEHQTGKKLQYFQDAYYWEPKQTKNGAPIIWILHFKEHAGTITELIPLNAVIPYNINKLLDKYTIDDITTAIDIAWQLSGREVEAVLKFHEETKLLVASGTEREINIMLEVIKTLEISLEKEAKSPQENFSVSVLGHVNKPGVIECKPGTTLATVISLAGGMTRTANTQRVKIVRKTEASKEPQTILVNLAKILKGEDKDTPLMEGDLISIDERIF